MPATQDKDQTSLFQMPPWDSKRSCIVLRLGSWRAEFREQGTCACSFVKCQRSSPWEGNPGLSAEASVAGATHQPPSFTECWVPGWEPGAGGWGGGRKSRIELNTVPAPSEPAVRGEIHQRLLSPSLSWREPPPRLPPGFPLSQNHVSLPDRASGRRGPCCPCQWRLGVVCTPPPVPWDSHLPQPMLQLTQSLDFSLVGTSPFLGVMNGWKNVANHPCRMSPKLN